MNIKWVISVIIFLVSFSASMSRALATETAEVAPQNMTCKEFVNLNPKYMAAIAFVVVNENSDLNSDNYVSLYEVETVSVPKMIKQCHQTPSAKLGELIGRGE
ncbi:ABC transporter substrate-binding protein [Citrobacter freundii]|uniref:HdeA/HdeB family chaperone n=1 Tax=Citrobacter freundii TaxID=546 RepID=UPI0015EAB30C|nr:ABC transporter substrate-binding protein [Citrobacter freundii]